MEGKWGRAAAEPGDGCCGGNQDEYPKGFPPSALILPA